MRTSLLRKGCAGLAGLAAGEGITVVVFLAIWPGRGGPHPGRGDAFFWTIVAGSVCSLMGTVIGILASRRDHVLRSILRGTVLSAIPGVGVFLLLLALPMTSGIAISMLPLVLLPGAGAGALAAYVASFVRSEPRAESAQE